jgi:inosine/xanthosine triphosphate pyrophosphatase family protein
VTFVENALAKARHASHTRAPGARRRFGICVDALGGAPA